MNPINQQKELIDKLNALSGYPLWEALGNSSCDVYLVLPPCAGGVPRSVPGVDLGDTVRFNCEGIIRKFIESKNLANVLEYRKETDRLTSIPAAFLKISEKVPKTLSHVLRRLESKSTLGSFQSTIREMLLAAKPAEVIHSVSVVSREYDRDHFKETQKHPWAKLATYALDFDTTRELIAKLALEAKSVGDSEEKQVANAWLDLLGKKIPALASYIARQRPCNEVNVNVAVVAGRVLEVVPTIHLGENQKAVASRELVGGTRNARSSRG